MGVARDERELLSDLFTETGPDEPTLCGRWRTRDLAAHLVVRERRLDAAPGILLKPLAGYTERVQAGYAAKPWPQLVDLIRSGPPALSPYGLGAVDELVNTAEYFVHHEDVRRARPGWEPRPADAKRDDALWKGLGRMGKLLFRRSPVGVLLRRPGGAEIAAKRGPGTVTVIGEPGELLLFGFGRDEVRLEFEGDQASVAALRGVDRSF